MSVTTERSLGPLSQIPDGEGRLFRLEDGGDRESCRAAARTAETTDGPMGAGAAELAVFRVRGGALYATQAACPHRGGPLADGLIGGTTLICPLHGQRFDVATGESMSGGCGLVTFPVRVTDAGEIMVAMPGAAPER